MTPLRYRSFATGVDLSEKSDAELRVILTNASRMVNSAIGAPPGYSLLGGTVVGEEHQWNVGNAYQPASGRLWPYYRPLRGASQIRVNVTKTQYISFNEDQIFSQNDIGYIEPVAAPTTTALFTSVPPWLLTSPVAYLDYEYGFHFVVIDEEPATMSGELWASNQFLFTDEDVELKKNGAVVDRNDYDVDYTEGIVTPIDLFTEDDEFLFSYHHKLPPDAQIATSLIANDMVGQTAIAAAGLIGLSGIKVEEVEIRQSSKINFSVMPVNPAAKVYLADLAAMFATMR